MAAPTRTIAVYADTRGPGTCRGCGARMTWAEVVASGKRMCFTGDPVALRTEHGADHRLIEHLDFAENHWATCPEAPSFRRRGGATGAR